MTFLDVSFWTKTVITQKLLNISLLVLAMLGLALLQTHTIWDYYGIRVDEKALFMYAVGFFGGDYNPHWFGYGSLGMYVLHLVYLLLAVFPLLGGYFSSVDAYAMQVFYNGYFVLVARYIFALFGIGAVFLYAYTAKSCRMPTWLIGLFAVVCLLANDSIYYANYLRSDYLLGFFVALSVFCAMKSQSKVYLYVLAASTAGAICVKISALPLVFFLLAYTTYRKVDGALSWLHYFSILLSFVLFLHLFQPYAPWLETIKGIINLGASGEPHHFNWGKNYFYDLNERLSAIFAILRANCTDPILAALLLIGFARQYLTILVPCLLMLMLLIAPYLNSAEITFYWFAPAFNLIRFTALISIAGFLSFLDSRLLRNEYLKTAHYGKPLIKTLIALVIISGCCYSIIYPAYQSYCRQYVWKKTNRELAQEWIIQNLLETEYIAIEWRYSHVTPKLYDRNNLEESKRISRYFMYNRNNNQFLNDLFETYLQDHYYHLIGVKQVKGVRRHIHLPSSWQATGYYYVTSPNIYNRYLKRDPDRAPSHLHAEHHKRVQYHKHLISYPMVKSFRSGRGPDIEIYHITPLAE